MNYNQRNFSVKAFIMKKELATVFLVLLGCGPVLSQQTNDGWKNMFNGTNLEGYTAICKQKQID